MISYAILFTTKDNEEFILCESPDRDKTIELRIGPKRIKMTEDDLNRFLGCLPENCGRFSYYAHSRLRFRPEVDENEDEA